MGRIWFSASGSGGVGKSSVAVGLAETAARLGLRTLLLDTAGPSRTCDLYLGIQSLITVDLTDVLLDKLPIESAIYAVRSFSNFSYCCTSLFSGVRLDEFSSLLLTLQGLYDLILTDLPTGELTIGPSMLREEDRIILITRPDPFAIRAGEMLCTRFRSVPAPVCPVVNFEERSLLRKRLQYPADTVAQLLDCPVAGIIPRSSDFFSLHADGERLAALSFREQRLFRALYDAIAR